MTPVGAFPLYTRFWTRAAPVTIAVVAVLVIALGGSAFRRTSGAPGNARAASAAAFLLCVLVAVDLLACGFFGMAASRYLERVVALPVVALLVLVSSRQGAIESGS